MTVLDTIGNFTLERPAYFSITSWTAWLPRAAEDRPSSRGRGSDYDEEVQALGA
jgi:hypothetical protein